MAIRLDRPIKISYWNYWIFQKIFITLLGAIIIINLQGNETKIVLHIKYLILISNTIILKKTQYKGLRDLFVIFLPHTAATDRKSIKNKQIWFKELASPVLTIKTVFVCLFFCNYLNFFRQTPLGLISLCILFTHTRSNSHFISVQRYFFALHFYTSREIQFNIVLDYFSRFNDQKWACWRDSHKKIAILFFCCSIKTKKQT